MDALVFLLNELERSSLLDDENAILRSCDDSIVGLIEAQATGILIAKNGEPDFDKIDELQREHGYLVFPGERDRFGWLTACLQTKKGVIVFG